jgi:hypothetical protein
MMMRYLGLGVGHMNSASFPNEADAILATREPRYVPPSQRESVQPSALTQPSASNLVVPPVLEMEVNLPEDLGIDDEGAEEAEDDEGIEAEDEEDLEFDEDDLDFEDEGSAQYDY